MWNRLNLFWLGAGVMNFHSVQKSLAFGSKAAITSLKSVVIGVLAFSLLGCFPKSSTPPVDPTLNAPLEHKVAYPGETLGLISVWYTGSVENWRKIAQYNKGLEVTKIRIGDRIMIPPDLVKQRNPLPKKVVSGGLAAATAASKQQSGAAAVKSEQASGEKSGVSQPKAVDSKSQEIGAKAQATATPDREPKAKAPAKDVSAAQAPPVAAAPTRAPTASAGKVQQPAQPPSFESFDPFAVEDSDKGGSPPPPPPSNSESTTPKAAVGGPGAPAVSPPQGGVSGATGSSGGAQQPNVPVVKSRDELLEELLN